MIDETDFIKKGGRKLYAYTCEFAECGELYYRRRDHVALNKKNGHKSFCSHECKNKNQITSELVPCGHCGKEVLKEQNQIKKTGASYCGYSCAASSNNRKTKKGNKHHQWKDGSGSYRQRALRELPNKCCKEDCEMTRIMGDIPIKMLDVDHINEDRTNNKIENLQILCVWCHAKKTRKLEN